MLKTADPMSIFNAACMAATLNLPLQNGLGFAYIVPFRNNKEKKTEAQFQIGYKGFIQLAQRSGQFKRLVALPVYKKQLLKKISLTVLSLTGNKNRKKANCRSVTTPILNW